MRSWRCLKREPASYTGKRRKKRKFQFHTKIIYSYSILQHVQSDPPTAKSLAQLVSQMIQFQEDYLGFKVDNPPFTRLPVS